MKLAMNLEASQRMMRYCRKLEVIDAVEFELCKTGLVTIAIEARLHLGLSPIVCQSGADIIIAITFFLSGRVLTPATISST